MKIGLYGNNLNQAYLLASILKSFGAEARVFLQRNVHHQDSHEWWDNESIDESLVIWIDKPIEAGSPLLKYNSSLRKLYFEASKYDILILREDGPALFSNLKGPKKIFSSQGADLQIWPWWVSVIYSPSSLKKLVISTWNSNRSSSILFRLYSIAYALARHLLLFYRFFLRQHRQRKGILQASAAIVAPYQAYLLDNLKYPTSRINYIPVPTYSLARTTTLQSSSVPSFVYSLYEENEFILLHPARLYFLDVDSNTFRKDNHKLIQGFKLFTNTYQGSIKLILVEKGNYSDISAAKEIIEGLGLSDLVLFVPEFRNPDLCCLLANPKTIVCDQFSPYLNSLGNLGREAVYYGRPLITSYDGADDVMYTSFPPNIFTANSSASVLSALNKVTSLSMAELRQIEESSNVWFKDNLDPLLCAKKYYNLFDGVLNL